MVTVKNIRNFIQKSFRFGLYIPFSNLVMTYGNNYLSDALLSRIAQKRNQRIQKIIIGIIGDDLTEVPKRQESLPASSVRKIWFCWMQGEENMPLVPRLCLQRIRRHAGKHEVVFLDSKNYRNYVSLPSSIEELYQAGQLKQAHFADILRVYLLAQQGGLWLDATLFVANDLPDYIFDTPFFSIKTAEFGHFVSRCRWAVFCLGGEKANPLFLQVARMFEVYLSRTTVFADYFLFDHFIDLLYQRNESIRKLIDEVPFNNGHVHALNGMLSQKFNLDQYREWCKDTFLFKLNWKAYSDQELLDNSANYYYHLLHL